MMYRSWLPQACLLESHISDRFQPVAERWLRKWIKQDFDVSVLISRSQSKENFASDSLFWECEESKIILAVDPMAKSAMLQSVFGANLKRLGYDSSIDNVLVDFMVQTIIEDLQPALCSFFQCSNQSFKLLPGNDSVRSYGEYALSVFLMHNLPVLHIFMDTNIAVAARKFNLCAANIDVFGDAREIGLSAIEVDIEASLGQAHIELAELKDLSCGYILIMDTNITDTIPIIISGYQTDILRAQIRRMGDGIALQLMRTTEMDQASV